MNEEDFLYHRKWDLKIALKMKLRKKIMNAVNKYAEDIEFTFNDIKGICKGIPEDEVKDAFISLLKVGEIYEPKKAVYKLLI